MLTTPGGAVVTDMSCAYCLERMPLLLAAHIVSFETSDCAAPVWSSGDC